jgi:hypothetical protein
MEQLVQAGLRITQGEDKVKQAVGEAFQGILSVKDVIGSALETVSRAALAWTSICFAMQVSQSPGFRSCTLTS